MKSFSVPSNNQFVFEGFPTDVSASSEEGGSHEVIDHAPDDKHLRPFIIGVSGGSASGKTSVCREIVQRILPQSSRVVIISQDSFYLGLGAEEHENAEEYNFDHPSAFDWDCMRVSLERFKKNLPVDVPTYDFVSHQRTEEVHQVSFADVILFEGILVFYNSEIRDQFDLKLFVETDSDTRLVRRIRRDISERGRTIQSVLDQYQRFVKPSFDDYIAPTKRYADVIIPRGASNTIAIDLIAKHIKTQMTTRRAQLK